MKKKTETILVEFESNIAYFGFVKYNVRVLNKLEEIEGQNRNNVMWGGDFNEHNTLWGVREQIIMVR